MEQIQPVASEMSDAEVNNCNYSGIRETKCHSSVFSSSPHLSSQIALNLDEDSPLGVLICGGLPCGGPVQVRPGQATVSYPQRSGQLLETSHT